MNVFLNKTVLRSFLNGVNGICLISVSSEFQTMGAHTLNHRSPSFFSFDFGTVSLRCLSEETFGWFQATRVDIQGCHRLGFFMWSMRFCILCASALVTSEAWCGICWSGWLMLSYFRSPNMSRTAAVVSL